MDCDSMIAAPMDEESDGLQETSKLVDDHSTMIADKLLQGWALLNEHCPRCYTPLVRNKERRMYCVKCKQWVVTEAEAKQSQKDEEAQAQAQVHHPVAGETLKGLGNGGNHCRVASSRNGEDVLEERSPKRLAAEGVFTGSNSSGGLMLLPKVNPLLDIEMVQTNTLRTLFEKVEETRCLIAMTRDVSQLKQLLDVLSNCLQCITSLKALARNSINAC